MNRFVFSPPILPWMLAFELASRLQLAFTQYSFPNRALLPDFWLAWGGFLVV